MLRLGLQLSGSLPSHNLLRRALVVSLVTVVLGCATHSGVSTGPDGLRTFTVVRELDGNPVVCKGSGIVPHGVEGILDGQAGAKDPVWLVNQTGARISVVWPEGFTVRFTPRVELLNEKGAIVATGGDPVELGQVSEGDAKGTYEDPYMASGIVFGSCYPYLR